MHAEGFLHAKCWLFYGDRPGQLSLFDRFRPVAAIVGSSNFTAPGLTSIGQAKELIEAVRRLKGMVAEPDAPTYGGTPRAPLRREDLRLVCFDFLSGG